jgi:RND family efflux transporter MFP subunit
MQWRNRPDQTRTGAAAVCRTVRRAGLAAAILALGAAACGGGKDSASAAANAADAPRPIQIGQENVIKVESGRLVIGPIVSGELRPAREATVRAELGGSMTAVLVEEGQHTRQGAVIARIETRTLDDARQSANTALKSAESQLALAQREVARTEQLVQAGALATRDLDVARANVSTVEAQVADARSRLAAAERNLRDAVILAPLTGIVSRRAVNRGDVVSPGTELFTVIDPSSMRLEASVPSEDLSALKVGAVVDFTVRGYQQTFQGKIERIAPQADPTTRQVRIYVAIPNVNNQLVAGLYAEGRVVSQSATGLILPQTAVNTDGGDAWVLRVTDGKTERVPVTVTLTDPRTERVLVASGVSSSDTLLQGPSRSIPPGTPVQVPAAQ